ELLSEGIIGFKLLKERRSCESFIPFSLLSGAYRGRCRSKAADRQRKLFYPPDSGRLPAGWRAGRSILPGLECEAPALREKSLLHGHQAQISRRCPGRRLAAVHAAVAIGDDRRAAILCMIAAN